MGTYKNTPPLNILVFKGGSIFKPKIVIFTMFSKKQLILPYHYIPFSKKCHVKL